MTMSFNRFRPPRDHGGSPIHADYLDARVPVLDVAIAVMLTVTKPGDVEVASVGGIDGGVELICPAVPRPQ
jgi:hypothetical protein